MPSKHPGMPEHTISSHRTPKLHDTIPRRLTVQSFADAKSKRTWVFTQKEHLEKVLKRKAAPVGIVAVTIEAQKLRSVTPL
jgi:hypothetical protein